MENITKQAIKLFLVFFVLTQMSNVTAQNIVYEVSNVKSNNTIIREYEDGCYLIYNDIGGAATFGYADISSVDYTEASATVPIMITMLCLATKNFSE